MSSGGGFITDAFPEMVRGVGSVLEFAQRLGKPTAMMGQGLGPLTAPELREIATRTLPLLRLLSLRESAESPTVASQLGVPNERVMVTGDDAIEVAYAQRPANMGEHLGINVRIAAYSELSDFARNLVKKAMHALLSSLGARALIAPISLINNEDEDASRSLLPAGTESLESRVVTPADITRIVGRCRVVVTGSYHAGVFALSQGIPVLGLAQSHYYRGKFRGLASQFPGGCEWVDLEDAGASERIVRQTLGLWKRAGELSPTILASARSQITSARAAYQRLGYLVQDAERQRVSM